MADDSNIVLRCEFKNAAAKFQAGKMESEEFNEGGFKWKFAVERLPRPHFDLMTLSLRCDVDNHDSWKCEAEVDARVPKGQGRDRELHAGGWVRKETFLIEKSNNCWMKKSPLGWIHFNPEYYPYVDDTVTIEFLIKIISSDRGQPMFTTPNRKSNVMLKIGDKTLHVFKELLAIHSPVFEAMFFGEYAEKGKEEVELHDVIYEEFLDVLHIIYIEPIEITDGKVPHLLKLADHFQMESVLNQTKEHLTRTGGIDFMEKIVSSDRGQPKFTTPNRKSNVMLKIGDKTLHVFKELLAIHSPVFEAMFFGEYAEKGKEEVELHDVIYEEFLDVLHIIYVEPIEITDGKVPHLLKLADRFQMESVLSQTTEHLTRTRGIDVLVKLTFADQYRLASLRDQCLKSFTNAADMSQEVEWALEHANFSDETIAAIFNRIEDLNDGVVRNSRCQK